MYKDYKYKGVSVIIPIEHDSEGYYENFISKLPERLTCTTADLHDQIEDLKAEIAALKEQVNNTD